MEDYTNKTEEDLLEILEDLNEQQEMFEEDLDDRDYKMMYDKNAQEIIKINAALSELNTDAPVEQDLDQNTLDEIEDDERKFAQETDSSPAEEFVETVEEIETKPIEIKQVSQENLDNIKFSDIKVDNSLFFAKGGAIYEGDKVKIKDSGTTMKVTDISKNKKDQVEFSGEKGSYLIGDIEKMAKGGEVIFTDLKDNTSSRKIWESKKSSNGQKSFGAFAHKIDKKYIGDYYLYKLDDYDEKFYSHIPLKDGEMLARVQTDNMVTGEMPLVKINIKNGRVYFMSEDNDLNSDYDDKNPKFNRASANVVFLSLDKAIKDYAKGGKVKRYIVHKGDGYDGEVLGSSDTFRGASMIEKRLEKKGAFDDVDTYGIKDTDDYFYRRKDNKYAEGGFIKDNYWGIDKGEYDELIEEKQLDLGKWFLYYNEAMKEWEATMDGNYTHTFKSLNDLMERKNEIDLYEYDEELTEEYGEEVITNSKGEIRKYAKGGSVRRTNISPLLRYTNFEDGWVFNLVKLNPLRNQDGLKYKGNYKYGISRQGPGKNQEVWQYATLEEANKKYDELIELGKTYSKIKTKGNISKNYAKGGTIDKNLTYKGEVVGFKGDDTGGAVFLGDIDIPKNSTPKSIIELAKSKFKRTWYVEVSKDGEYLYEIADDSYKGEYPMVTAYAKGGEVDSDKVKKGDEIYREHNRERIKKGIEQFSEESSNLWIEKYDDRLKKLNLNSDEKSALNPENWYAKGGLLWNDIYEKYPGSKYYMARTQLQGSPVKLTIKEKTGEKTSSGRDIYKDTPIKTYVEKEGLFYEEYAKGGVTPHYNAVALEHRHNLKYGDSKRFASEKEAIEWGKNKFKEDGVGLVEIDRVRPKGENPKDLLIDTVYRVNDTYPLGERVVMKPFAKGGETDSPITNYKKNIMGTTSFDLKVKGMRKPQDFIVYPITEKTDKIRIQSDKKFGEIHLPTGKGILSKSGNTSWHLASDMMNRNVNTFELSEAELQEFINQIKSTSGKSVGSSFVKSDNSGARLLEDGGKLDMNEIDIYQGLDGDYTIVMHGDVYEMNYHTMPNMSIDMYAGNRAEFPADISHWGKIITYEKAPIIIKNKIEKRAEEYNKQFAKGGEVSDKRQRVAEFLVMMDYDNGKYDEELDREYGSVTPEEAIEWELKNRVKTDEDADYYLDEDGDLVMEKGGKVDLKKFDKEIAEQIDILESMIKEEKDEGLRKELMEEIEKMKKVL